MKKKKKFLKKIKWNHCLHIVRIIEVTAIVLGLYFAIIQLQDVRNMQSAQLMLKFNENLNSETNTGIIIALENNEPLFIKNKGKFSSADIDRYLSIYELLNSTHDAGLITDAMLYNAFAYNIEKTLENKEIQNYLLEIREDDELFFRGYEVLANALKNAE
jgi:hypothetical protein